MRIELARQRFQEASPAVQKLCRAAALLHSFTRAEFKLLAVETLSLAEAVRAGLIETDSTTYRVLPALRRELFVAWEADNLRRESRVIARYFIGAEPLSADHLERIYHLLIGVEATGRAELEQALRQAAAEWRTGTAEQLLAYGLELEGLISAETLRYLKLERARLQVQFGAITADDLHLLYADARDDAMRGDIRMLIAQVEATNQRWEESEAAYRAALELMTVPLQRSRAYVGLSANVLQMVTQMGGFGQPIGRLTPAEWFLHAPFLLYRHLSRRMRWLPNLYFGTNFQDWDAVKWLRQAARWLEKGIDAAKQDVTQEDDWVIGLQLRLVFIYLQIDCWREAQNLLSKLSRFVRPETRNALLLELAQGQFALLKGDVAQAVRLLRGTAERLNEQPHDALLVNELLAVAEQARGDERAALRAFERAMVAALNLGDYVSATRNWFALAELSDSPPPLPMKAFITRTSENRLQQMRRRVAYFSAVPTYLFAQLIMFLLVFALLVFEWGVRTTVEGTLPTSMIADILLVPQSLPLAIWLYEFVYLVVGWIGRKPIFQPTYIVTSPEALIITQPTKQTTLHWGDIQQAAIVNRALWREPSKLFSQVLLDQTVQIDATVTHYDAVVREIKAHIPNTQMFNTSLLRGWSITIGLPLAIIMAFIAVLPQLNARGKWFTYSVTVIGVGEETLIPLTTALHQIAMWSLFFVPLVALLRVALLRWREGQWLAKRQSWGASVVLWGYIVALVLLTILFILTALQR